MPPPLTQAPSGRRPAFRGVIMEDISGGKTRVRSWPRKRGKAKTAAEQDRQDKFAAAQLAARYISPQQMVDIINARAGTPLLPRDVVTSIQYNRLAMFVLPDGRRWYPMPAYNDVSECLDTISQTPGDLLIRGTNGWEPIAYTPPSGTTGPVTAYRAAAANNVTGNGTFWPVAYDSQAGSETWFTLNTSTGEITINEDGRYLIEGSARFTGEPAGDWCGAHIRLNGNIEDYWRIDATNSLQQWPKIVTVKQLEAGDAFNIEAAVGGGTLIADAVVGQFATCCKVTRLG